MPISTSQSKRLKYQHFSLPDSDSLGIAKLPLSGAVWYESSEVKVTYDKCHPNTCLSMSA